MMLDYAKKLRKAADVIEDLFRDTPMQSSVERHEHVANAIRKRVHRRIVKTVEPPKSKRKPLSAKARAAIGRAQRLRWAKLRKQG